MRKVFLWTIVVLIALEALSFGTFRHSSVAGGILLLVVVTLGVVAWRRPWILPLAMVAELAIGGKGYLLSLHWHGVWPVRLFLFLLMILLVVIRAKAWKLSWPPRQALFWPFLLVLWVGWGTIWGLMQGYPIGRVFLDMNAFLYLPVIGLWWALLKQRQDRTDLLFAVVSSGVVVTTALGMFLTIVFGSSWSIAPELYSWIWQTRTGEIAMIGSHTYRVFLQSQIFGLLVGLLLLMRSSTTWKRWMWIPLVAGSASVFISLSRSFWLGLVAGLIIVAGMLWKQRSMSTTVLRRAAVAIVGGYLLMNWASNFPNPIPWLGTRNAISSRITDIGGAQAASARWNQIEPLVEAISRHPIIGRGFGTEVSFYSPDPRTQGTRTATAFELGYLDWWLDLGAIGVLLILGWGMALLRKSWSSSDHRYLAPTIVALFAVHLTTLYLNFPVGLGWLGLMTIALYDHE